MSRFLSALLICLIACAWIPSAAAADPVDPPLRIGILAPAGELPRASQITIATAIFQTGTVEPISVHLLPPPGITIQQIRVTGAHSADCAADTCTISLDPDQPASLLWQLGIPADAQPGLATIRATAATATANTSIARHLRICCTGAMSPRRWFPMISQ